MTGAAAPVASPLGFDLARPLLPAEVALAATDPRAAHHRALPEERAGLARAVDRRQREFAAGRAAARQAMAQLGLPPRPVLRGADRAPVWPAGLIGSISHTKTACLAAVARHGAIRAVGLDVEQDTPLAADLFAAICTPAEQARLAALPAEHRGQAAKLIFSAKECAYKCQYAISRTLYDFHTMEVTADNGAGGFRAVFLRDIPPFAAGATLAGRCAVGDGLIVTAMTLRG